jgi:hypothetical protein
VNIKYFVDNPKRRGTLPSSHGAVNEFTVNIVNNADASLGITALLQGP